MAKVDSIGAGLIPVALAAGVFSGAVFKTSAPPEPPRPGPRTSAAAQANDPEPAPRAPRLSDLRPVMELLGQSLGVSIEADESVRAVRALRVDIDRTGGSAEELRGALRRLEAFLARRGATSSGALAEDPAQLLDAYLRTEIDPVARLHKLQSKAADRLFDDFNDAEALRKLTAGAGNEGSPRLDISFLVATVPDYVDSNSGWVADEVLGAIQAAMGQADFLLDRFRLIDWSRADAAHMDGVINESRLHERQPGALIFRRTRAEAGAVDFKVVLLVLETPTGGVHRAALKNAIHFVHKWQTLTSPHDPAGPHEPELKVVAPVFSGSVPSLAMELRNWEGVPSNINLVSGSAMADANPCIVEAFAPGVEYKAAIQPTSVVMNALQQSLERMNPEWGAGKHVALLVEGNTSFGASANPVVQASHSRVAECQPVFTKNPFTSEFVYTFPLHVSQLRDDAQAQPASPVSLLPTPIVPLNFRETTPASDQIPALRPQLTSPVAEATIDSILDNIRHENVSAVGIVATDSRDVLFLAREVKKGAPDVQLFLAGSYLLYLHPQYIPYTRGAVVASPYPLALNAQRGINGDSKRLMTRQPFPSLISAGVFNATLIQLGEEHKLVDYCDPGVNLIAAGQRDTGTTWASCTPPVWVTVIGDDGYWPLTRNTSTAGFVPSFRDSPPQHHQVPITITAGLMAIALALIVAGLSWAAAHVCNGLRRGQRHFSESIIGLLAPPVTFPIVARMHALALLLCSLMLACVSAWFTAILVLQQAVQLTALDSRARLLVEAVVWIVFALVMVPGAALAWKSFGADSTALGEHDGPRAPLPRWNSALMAGSLALMAAAIAYFMGFVHDTIQAGDAADIAFKIERFVAGGIVSPAPITICLFAALLAGMLAGLRRLSMVGQGYTALAHQSPAFRLFAGAPNECAGTGLSTNPGCREKESRDLRHLTALLDMPVQNLPRQYLVGIIAAVGLVMYGAGRVSTVDGAAFSRFVTGASLSVLVTALLLVSQSVATWGELKPKLARLARTRLDRTLGTVGHVIGWDLSIVPPRLSELTPLATRAERLRSSMLSMANAHLHRKFAHGVPDRRAPQDPALLKWYEASLGLRPNDLMSLTNRLDAQPHVDADLRAEILNHTAAPLLQSRTWFRLWAISDRLVGVLEGVHWKRCGGLPCDGTPTAEGQAVPEPAGRKPSDAAQLTIDKWFTDCEEFVALQYAFLLRDVLARIMSSLFAAMLCLTLMTAAHLFYLFQGRSSLLLVDLLAVGVTAVAAIRIVVGMERDTVLSHLRVTTPGRVDFNWDFVKRVGVYGVVPLLAVIGSLFPEIGESFFGWLEPIRKLASF